MIMPSVLAGTCKETAQQISDYLEGRMSFLRRFRVRLHLKKCPPCERWIESLRVTHKAVDKARILEQSKGIPAECREKIEKIFRS